MACGPQPMLYRERKRILKLILALALTLWSLPALAVPDDLVVGGVHDTDGFPVAAATVTLRATGGSPIAGGTTAGDGTFAVEARTAVADVEIRCAHCLQLTMAFRSH